MYVEPCIWQDYNEMIVKKSCFFLTPKYFIYIAILWHISNYNTLYWELGHYSSDKEKTNSAGN